MSLTGENTGLLIVEPKRSRALQFARMAKIKNIKAQWACNLKVAEMLLRGCHYNYVLIDVGLSDGLREALGNSYLNIEVTNSNLIYVDEMIFNNQRNFNTILTLIKEYRDFLRCSYDNLITSEFAKSKNDLRDANNYNLPSEKMKIKSQASYTRYNTEPNESSKNMSESYRIDTLHKILIVSGNIIKLTNLEYILIQRILSGEAVSLNTSERVLLSRLKTKIRKISGMSIIKNRYGQGYYWGLD